MLLNRALYSNFQLKFLSLHLGQPDTIPLGRIGHSGMGSNLINSGGGSTCILRHACCSEGFTLKGCNLDCQQVWEAPVTCKINVWETNVKSSNYTKL